MQISENDFILQDRIQKIKSIVEQYGDNCIISFSGGKDSTVLHYLFDLALPNNKIPRVFCNTGIEYNLIVDFVKQLQKSDDRIEIIMPKIPIKKMLEEHGYPFKSKHHSRAVHDYRMHGRFITWLEHYYKGESATGTKYSSFNTCPNILKYQLEDVNSTDFPISDKCCYYLKKKPIESYCREHKVDYQIIGIMQAEEGRRKTAKCTVFHDGKIKVFQPLALLIKDWEDWFVQKYNIKLADLYYPPYNFTRTGCKGCPYSTQLQYNLDTLEKYFPNERKQCEVIWKPVYNEYRWLGYRLKKYY